MVRFLLVTVRFVSTGADPGFFLGGGALVSCSTSTPINHIVSFFFLAEYQQTAGHLRGRGGGAHPLHPLPRSAHALYEGFKKSQHGEKNAFLAVLLLLKSTLILR